MLRKFVIVAGIVLATLRATLDAQPVEAGQYRSVYRYRVRQPAYRRVYVRPLYCVGPCGYVIPPRVEVYYRY